MLSNLPWLKSLISLILHKDLSDCMQSKTKLNSFYLCVCSVASDCGPMGCGPMGSSPPGSSVHGIIQTRILQRVAIAFSKCPSLQVENHPEEKQDVLKMKGRYHGSWQTFSFCSHQSGFYGGHAADLSLWAVPCWDRCPGRSVTWFYTFTETLKRFALSWT